MKAILTTQYLSFLKVFFSNLVLELPATEIRIKAFVGYNFIFYHNCIY